MQTPDDDQLLTSGTFLQLTELLLLSRYFTYCCVYVLLICLYCLLIFSFCWIKITQCIEAVIFCLCVICDMSSTFWGKFNLPPSHSQLWQRQCYKSAKSHCIFLFQGTQEVAFPSFPCSKVWSCHHVWCSCLMANSM